MDRQTPLFPVEEREQSMTYFLISVKQFISKYTFNSIYNIGNCFEKGIGKAFG